MATIRIYDGKTYIEIEVEESFALEYQEMEHKDSLVERKETRRHQSLDKSMENGFDVPDPHINVEEQTSRREMEDRLYTAIGKLEPQQRKLVQQIYFEEMTVTELARLYGVSKAAISDRLKKIHNRLRKYLE